jgi:predicted permease
MRIAHWWYTVPLRLRSLFDRRRVESELDEELQFHLENAIADGVMAGLAPREARRRALLAMGGPQQRREEIRDARRLNWLLDFLADLRFASRSLRRTPGLTAIVVVTLALGIGMTAMPFSMLDALVLRPYPVPDPEDVVTLVGTSRDQAFGLFSFREYVDLRDRARSYDGVVASTPARGVAFAADARATPRVKTGVLVSGNYFSVLGVEPALGRGFRPEEDTVPGRDAVVVVGHRFWEQELGADRAAVGRPIRLNGDDFTVVGVLPESFPGMTLFTLPDVFVPLAMARRFSTDPKKDFFEDRDDRELRVMARLAPGTTLRAARGEIAGIAAAFRREHPAVSRDRDAAVRTAFEMRTRADDGNWKFSVAFTVLGVAVLLVASTNVAGLLLSRARARTREVAVRLALGAGRSRLVRLLLAESLILSGIGAGCGVLAAFAGIEYLQEFNIPAELPVTVPFRMDVRVLLASLGVAGLAALLCGLTPALQSTRADLVTGLKASDVEPRGRKRLWGRSALVVVQVAMSLMLLAASLLMARSFREGAAEGVGFVKERLLMAAFDPRLVQYDAARTRQFYEQLTERVAAIPGVVGVGLSRHPPLNLDGFEALSFVPEGYQLPAGRESFVAPVDVVDTGFFGTVGIALLRGRGFLASDTGEAPRVAVVNETLARRYWPDGDAVGKRIRLDHRDGEPVEVVGVARTVKYESTDEKPRDFVYLPLGQSPQARLVLLLRTAGDPLLHVDALREVVRGLVVGSMGVVGLVLTVAGLYGLIAYNVSRRTKEIGIRLAVGATPATAFRIVLGGGLALVGIGTAIGLVLGLGVEKLMIAALFDARGTDLVAYLVVVPSMLLITVLAAWVPARRAARIPPTLALRHE